MIERFSLPVTATGRPRNTGFDCCSTAAKNAFISTCMMVFIRPEARGARRENQNHFSARSLLSFKAQKHAKKTEQRKTLFFAVLFLPGAFALEAF